MWLRMLELIYTPFVLLFVTYNNSGSNPFRIQKSKPVVSTEPNYNNVSVVNCSSYELFYNHPNPEKRGCYPENSTLPCEINMKIYSIGNSRYGECDCDTASRIFLLYLNETRRCHPIFEQVEGYCKIGEQLVITRENPFVPVCKRTVCYEKLIDPDGKKKNWVPLKIDNIATCVELGSTCNGTSSRRHVYGFENNSTSNLISIVPSCIDRRLSMGRSIGAPRVRCSPGTYRAISGHCQLPIFDDWD